MFMLAIFCAPAWAEEYGTVVLMDGGKTISSDSEEMIMEYNASPQTLLEHFKSQFGEDKEIRFRDRGDMFTVEDMGSRPWRRIIISKAAPDKTTVTVNMLTWKWITIMLALRFMGVFIVLLVLFISMSLATNMIRRIVEKKAPQPA